jgi:hypothetical protein
MLSQLQAVKISFIVAVVPVLVASAQCAAQSSGDALRRESIRARDALFEIEGKGRQSYGASYVGVSSQEGRYIYNRIEFCLRGGVGTIVTIDDAKLKNLEGLTGIVGLDLSETKITDAGLASLKGLETLEYLQLAKKAVTDRGLEHLVGLRHLQALDLVDTLVTQEASKVLTRLPRLKVVYAKGTRLTGVKNGVRVDREHGSEPWIFERDVDPLKSVIDVRKEEALRRDQGSR